MDLETLDWDDELLLLFFDTRAMLPEIASSAPSEPYGVTLATSVMVRCRSPEFSVISMRPWSVGLRLAPRNTYGTGNFLLLNTGEKRSCDRPANHGVLPPRERQTRVRAEGAPIATAWWQWRSAGSRAQRGAGPPGPRHRTWLRRRFRGCSRHTFGGPMRAARSLSRLNTNAHLARNAGGDLLPEPRYVVGRHGRPVGVEGGWRDQPATTCMQIQPTLRGCGAAGGRRDHRTRWPTAAYVNAPGRPGPICGPPREDKRWTPTWGRRRAKPRVTPAGARRCSGP